MFWKGRSNDLVHGSFNSSFGIDKKPYSPIDGPLVRVSPLWIQWPFIKEDYHNSEVVKLLNYASQQYALTVGCHFIDDLLMTEYVGEIF